MSTQIRIRARVRNGLTEVTVLLPHPMETGLRRNAAGEPVPAHFITGVKATIDGRTVFDARLSMAVSQDPLLTFRCRGAEAGAPIVVTWKDSSGDSRTDQSFVG